MELGGAWKAIEASEELLRVFADPVFDDSGWAAIDVPDHWRSSEPFAASDGPLLYRRRFDQPAPAPGRRRWLVLDGLFYQGDVWLDGTYLGDTEGYFFPHQFDVTDASVAGAEHVLGIEVTCAPQRDRGAKRNFTGVFQHWDCLDPEWNPGGIWRPARLIETGPVRLSDLSVRCREASAERAVLAFRAVLDAADAGPAVIRTTVGDLDDEVTRPLAAGENHVEWAVTIAQPRLWWPWALGDQPRYDVTVEVHAGDGAELGEPSDRRSLTTGLRQIAMHDWIVSVNGERLFLKGSNHGPTRMALADASAGEIGGDVALAKDAGLDFLRVHAHIARPELYEAADAAGLLLWQDLPLQWGYARGTRPQAVRQARAAVTVLGHHPSVFVWCGHNEPMAIDVEPGAPFDRRQVRRLARKMVIAQQLPTWNRTVLDRSIKRALERSDSTRPVIAHSGVLPHLPQLDGTDSHLYFGWYHGDERDLPGAIAAMPRLARFVTEFGAQAVPEDASFCEPERWPDLDWDRLGRRHCLQRDLMARRVDPADHKTFDDWRDATQAYQATVIKHHVETLRRLKYRPAGGFAQFCFADGMPAITWSVLGHDRRPKAGYHALAEACRPVIVVADRMPASVRAGDALALDVHVVSDLRQGLTGLVCTARLSWPGGGTHSWRWRGDVPADACVRVGTIQFVIPDATGPGEVALELELTGPASAANRYSARLADLQPFRRVGHRRGR